MESPSPIALFDAYCKKVIKNAAIDYQRGRKSRFRDTEFIDWYDNLIGDRNICSEYTMGEYCAAFAVNGHSILICHEGLTSALESLPLVKRQIILLYYWNSMTDQEIAEALHMNRRTVNFNRSRAIMQLRRTLEAQLHGA